MLVIRRLAAALTLGMPLLLVAAVRHEQGQASYATAQAQSAAAPARVELFLPPARIAPPVPVPAPIPARRVVAHPAPAPDPEEALFGRLQREAQRVSHLRWKSGLTTVSRVGHRLLYRKGYLGETPVHLVVADLNDPEVKLGVLVARGGVGTTESFASMVQRAQPTAAITGTFFGLKNSLPTGDLVVNGRAIYQGFVGTALAFTEGNVVSFIPTGYKAKTSWRFFNGVMRTGPLLVQSGRIAVGPREEGFVSLSPAAQRPRTAVGITAGRKLLLLAVKTPISLWRLAKLMRELGAFHAVAMDGGTSTGLYFGGRMVAQPGRALTNALVVYGRRERYERARTTFLGGPMSHLEARRSPQPPPLLLRIETAPDDEPATPGDNSDATQADIQPVAGARDPLRDATPAEGAIPALPSTLGTESEPATMVPVAGAK